MQSPQGSQQTAYRKTTAWTIVFVASSVAAYAMVRQGRYAVAMQFYAKGGVGINFYEKQADGHLKRRYALDCHSFWDKDRQRHCFRPHYHRGESNAQMRKHRPWEGGW